MFIRMSEVNQPTKLMERGVDDDLPPQYRPKCKINVQPYLVPQVKICIL